MSNASISGALVCFENQRLNMCKLFNIIQNFLLALLQSVIANKSRTPHRTPKRKTRAATKSLEDQNEKANKMENTPAVKTPNEAAEKRTEGTTEQLTTDPAPEQVTLFS